MSAANRGAKRRRNDWYGTPGWCGRTLRHLELPGGHWVEPCAGEGAIIRAVNDVRQDVTWSYCEIRERCAPILSKMCRTGELGGERRGCGVIDNFLTTKAFDDKKIDAFVSNPPFIIAEKIIERCMQIEPTAMIVMLLRTNYLESDRRAMFMQNHAPDVYVLPNRPSFVRNKHGKRATDATSYGWFVWPGAKKRSSGKIVVLPPVSRAERVASEEENYGQPRRTTA